MSSQLNVWLWVMALSVITDTVATVVMAKAGQYFDGKSFLVANALTVLLYGPSIFLLGYALKQDDAVPFVITVGVWTSGVAIVNAIAGFTVLGNPVNLRAVAAIVGIAICAYFLATSEPSSEETSADIPQAVESVNGQRATLLDAT